MFPFPPCFNPLHCGAVVASGILEWFLTQGSISFNPLHCGAVVASCMGLVCFKILYLVSIPFIAGQWSLPTDDLVFILDTLFVSIPFIAGQWSLRFLETDVAFFKAVFQSPSLRGSGRFPGVLQGGKYGIQGFNPLHCGAVVASWTPSIAKVALWFRFQSPSLRGSGRFLDAIDREGSIVVQVSIPFIAGQWSLPALPADLADWNAVSQSPSLRGSGRFREAFPRPGAALWGLNPLHCGAVVASADRARAQERAQRVSIPFIAGQWSLLALSSHAPAHPARLNPLHCGAVVASRRGSGAALRRRRVSIPFIAGQWSLPPRTTPSSLFGVLLRNTRPACDHVLCARLHVWPKPVIIP